jgi:hypothetical protein
MGFHPTLCPIFFQDLLFFTRFDFLEGFFGIDGYVCCLKRSINTCYSQICCMGEAFSPTFSKLESLSDSHSCTLDLELSVYTCALAVFY